jgi:phage tail sheath protein FI
VDNITIADTVLPKDIATILYLGGGTDGAAVTEGEMVTGANLLSPVDSIPLKVLLDGGFATAVYQQALDTIASSRGDCVAILSTPVAAEANADYLNEITDYRKTSLNLNSSYSALFSPHVLVYDRFNDRRLYVAPDGYAAAAISFSAANYEIWFPPAGYKRGVVNVLDVRRRFTKGERDMLYDAGINPLRFAPGKGIAIWGQKTLLSRPSALDRLNVRLMLTDIEPGIQNALESFLFELNDTATRNLAVAMIESYMAGIQARRGVSEYLVVCDESNNTPSDIDNYRMNVDVFVRPNKAVEFIPLRVVITSQGLSFQQAAQAL